MGIGKIAMGYQAFKDILMLDYLDQAFHPFFLRSGLEIYV